MDQQNPPEPGIAGIAAGVAGCVVVMMACLGGAKYASPSWASPGGTGWSKTSSVLMGVGWLFAFGAAMGLMGLLKAVWAKLTGPGKK